MAYITDTSRGLAGTPLAQRLLQLPAGLRQRLASYRTYRATLTKLSALGDRELNDLGLSRDMIRDVAAAAAYTA